MAASELPNKGIRRAAKLAFLCFYRWVEKTGNIWLILYFFFGGRPHPAIFRDNSALLNYPWLCSGDHEVPGIESGSDMCKTSYQSQSQLCIFNSWSFLLFFIQCCCTVVQNIMGQCCISTCVYTPRSLSQMPREMELTALTFLSRLAQSKVVGVSTVSHTSQLTLQAPTGLNLKCPDATTRGCWNPKTDALNSWLYPQK